MNNNQQRIFESIAGTASQSRLEPYREVILRWRRSRVSYRRILKALAANGVTVGRMTLYEFVQRRSRPRTDEPVPAESPQPNQTELKPMDMREEKQTPRPSRAERVAQREAIRAVHTKPALPDEPPKKEFVFDPDQPLINKNY